MIRKAQEFGASHPYRGYVIKIRVESDLWYISGNHPDHGRRFVKSLKTKSKAEAKRMVDEWIESENGTIETADNSITFKKLTDTYLMESEREVSPATIERITSSVRGFQRWLDSAHPHVQTISSLTRSKTRDFKVHRFDHDGVQARTVTNDIKNLHTICLWGMAEGLIKESPFNYSRNGAVKLPKSIRTKLVTYTTKERDMLIKLAKDAGDELVHDLVITLSDTGIRFDECAHISEHSVNWDQPIPTLTIEAHDGWCPKVHDQVRIIPLTPQAQEVLKRRQSMKRRSQYLFETSWGNPIKRNHTLVRLKALFPDAGIRLPFKDRAVEEAYIRKGGEPCRRLHFHSFRNYFIKKCFKSGITPLQIMHWVGHDEYKMVMHYAAASDGTEAGFDEFVKFGDG